MVVEVRLDAGYSATWLFSFARSQALGRPNHETSLGINDRIVEHGLLNLILIMQMMESSIWPSHPKRVSC